MTPEKRPKYGNRKTVVDGKTFDSAKEAQRYGELRLLERAGIISSLRCQPRFVMRVNGIDVCTYVADFDYHDSKKDRFVVEDVKGVRTKEYRIKKKLMLAIHGIDVVEV